MQISKEDFTILGTVAGWLMLIGGYFFKVRDHGDRLEKVEKLLFPPDGEPVIMTHPAHEKIANSCRSLVHQKLSSQDSVLKDHADRILIHEQKLDTILTKLDGISTKLVNREIADGAIVQELRKITSAMEKK